MSEVGGPQQPSQGEQLAHANELLRRGLLDEALELLEPLSKDKERRNEVRRLIAEFAARLAVSGPLPPRLARLIVELSLPTPELDEPFPRIPEFEPPRTSVGSRGPTRRGGSTRRGGISGASPHREPPVDVARPASTVARTPHLQVNASERISAGTSFTAIVFLDQLPSDEDEAAEAVRAIDGSQVEMTLGSSGHFVIDEETTKAFVLDASIDRIDVGSFSVRAVDNLGEVEGVPFLAAIFYVDGRPCGRVARTIEIEGVAGPEVAGNPPAREAAATNAAAPPSVEIGPNGSERADITVTIVAAEVNDGRSFICTVETRHAAVIGERKSAPWNLQSTTRDLVTGFMKRFTSQPAGSRQLIAELKGAGNVLFDGSPRIFRDTFWSLVDAGILIRTIAVVTAEPFVPWELMIPNRWKGDRYEERPALGVEFQVGRWTSEQVIAPSSRILLRDSFVIAPAYSGSRRLRNSDVEAAMVLRSYPGDRISPADFGNIETRLGSEVRSLIHFICHGDDDGTGIQSVVLEDGAQLSSYALLGMAGLARLFRAKRPVVFLNACKVGQTLPSLVGLGGFVVSFIKLGATAVIAPLWSVEDDVAHDIATQFYSQLTSDPTIPLAKVFSAIRAKAYEDGSGRDTYAAYCFYGDPFAALAS